MELQIEASPFINTNRNNDILYNIPFDYTLVANKFGEKPVKLFGFWESDNHYIERLDEWEKAEKNVLFDGWICKDMYHYQEIYYPNKSVIITFETNEYEVNYSNKKFQFPVLPETIDDFINDLKRIGIKLFWKKKIADLYVIDSITSNKPVIDYYNYIKNLNGE